MLHICKTQVIQDASNFHRQILFLRSNGLAGAFHSHLLGVYTLDDYNNGQNITKHSRYVFRQIDGENFMYFWDWGPNSGIGDHGSS